MSPRLHWVLAGVIAIGTLATGFVVSAQDDEIYPFATEEFRAVWERIDEPVAIHGEQRTLIWGPGPRSEAVVEEYVEAGPNGRVVQYFDKSRMEMPWIADADPDSPWFITQGLLATELMTGNLQLGDSEFEQHQPAEIPVAGDRNDTAGATYSTMGMLMAEDPRPADGVITAVVSREGLAGNNPDFEAYGVTDGHVDEVTGRSIASVFWDFMNTQGTISIDGNLTEGPLFENPLYAVGRPLTDAYWATILLRGEQHDVLTQCFERRCLTYAPENPDGWQVESGNIGMHYQEWRYETIDGGPPVQPDVTTFVENVSMPNALTFAPDGRLFFVETREGTIRVVQNGQLLPEPFARLDIAGIGGFSEYGVLGLALHPDFEQNGWVYVFYTQANEQGQPTDQRIVRFTDQNNAGTQETTIVSGLPFGPGGSHNAGRIDFGPDGYLYATLGDIEDPATSQDPNTVAGSVLRYDENGAIPTDNPFGADNPVYAYGLRNSFGIAFHPETGHLFLTDNGPDGYDEVNRIVSGGNYGWPNARGIAGDPDYIDPIWATGQSHAVAPTGITVPTGRALPDLGGKVLFCNWNTSELRALKLDSGNPDVVTGEEVLPVSCQLDVTEGPNGAIYASTADTIYRYGP